MDEFSLEEKKLIEKLKLMAAEIKPSKDMYGGMLNRLGASGVTDESLMRYNYSMWKYALAVVIVVIVGVAGFLFVSRNKISPKTQQPQISQSQDVPRGPVTASNADSTLQQTDNAISNVSGQMDQDLNSLDQTNQSEDDLGSI